MKILHLISQHPQQTGSGFYIQNMIRQCKKRGYQTHLLAGVSGDMIPSLPFLREDECTFIRFEKGRLDFTIPGMSDVMPYSSSRFSALTESQLNTYCEVFREAVAAVTKRFQPDLIHSHHLWLASDVTSKVCIKTPMVTSCHSTDLRQYLQNEHLQSRLKNICKIDRILALSSNQKQEISRIHGVKPSSISIVGGGYDSSRFTLGNKGTAPPVEFLYAGKLSRAKGVPFLLRAFAQLDPNKVRLHLVGSGTGVEKDECLQIAEKASEIVTVHGSMAQEKLAKLMQQCHVFVLPSFFEGLPLVLLEALSSGCRIVCSDLPGCRELLEGADENIADFIPLPEMQGVDSPVARQHDLYVANIRRTLEKMVDTVFEKPDLNDSDVHDFTHSYSWEAVFSRVEKAYLEVTGKKSNQ